MSPDDRPHVTGWVHGPIANTALACLSLRAVAICSALSTSLFALVRLSFTGLVQYVTLHSGPVLHAHACCSGALRAGWPVQPLHGRIGTHASGGCRHASNLG